MVTKLLLAIVPAVTVGVGALTWRSSPAAVPLERVELRAVEYVLAQEPDQAQPVQHLQLNVNYLTTYNVYRYRYASFPYRDPGFGYRNPGYQYAGFRYTDYRYGGFRYGSYRYSGYRYSGYRYAGYRYAGYRYTIPYRGTALESARGGGE